MSVVTDDITEPIHSIDTEQNGFRHSLMRYFENVLNNL